MKLLNTLFVVVDTLLIQEGFITTIELKPDHIVYKGHFPGHPVTPGVIQMQMVHELLENHLGKNLKLITMGECKFIKILNPKETPQIIIHIELTRMNEVVNVKAMGRNSTNTFFKLNSAYQLFN